MNHQVVSREAWLAARRALLAEEKAMTHSRDRLAEARRALPWLRLDKPYRFTGPQGELRFADLFLGRSQLVVQHFMLGPDDQEPCVGCSFQADHVAGALLHLQHHDVAFAAVARAPIARIEQVRRRMGWGFPFVSSHGSDFNYDFQVSFTPEQMASGEMTYNFAPLTEAWGPDLPGISVFYRDPSGTLFHTYSAFGRGGEELIGAYNYLDLTPKGRNETGPRGNLTDWVRLHDSYQESPLPRPPCCG